MEISLALISYTSSAFIISARPATRIQPVVPRVPSTQMFDLTSSYLNALNAHYYPTTCLQAGVLGVLGDGLAQALEPSAINDNSTAYSLDWQRTLRTGVLGVVIGGLGDAMWLRYLEEPGLFEPILGALDRFGTDHGVTLDADSLLVVIKTALDAFVWAPIANSLYLVLTPLSEGMDLAGVIGSLDDNFVPVMQSEWSVFFPYNLIAFAFLPPFIRPISTGIVSMLFSTYLSWITHLEPKVQPAADGLGVGLGEGMGELFVPLGRASEGTLADARNHNTAGDAPLDVVVVAAMERTDDAAGVVVAMDTVEAALAAQAPSTML